MIRLSFEGWVSQSRPYSFKTHHEQHQIHRRRRFAGAGHLGDQVGGRVAPRTRDVSLDIDSAELVALLGPSGCGKTTLLCIIAGLETADTGTIAFSGEDTTHVHVRERQVGFVFQHYALFRHMTVFENVAFGLRMRLADRYPSQLSGGQRQRIALARALAVEPKVLLLDEPFGALDAKVRKELRRWLRRLHDDVHVTRIFVES
ncbi:MAG: Sulfate/thiosulfate import ATP-binding protein CysA [Pseudomonadota bacterium]|jgi:sulfate transport system ATP-binding protein